MCTNSRSLDRARAARRDLERTAACRFSRLESAFTRKCLRFQLPTPRLPPNGPGASCGAGKKNVSRELCGGGLEGAPDTFRQGRGGPADLAALLIALLRAQDFPARFVTGTIILDRTRLANLLGTDDEKSSTLEALSAASRFLQRELGKRLTIRRTPRLAFVADDTLEEGSRILNLLDEAPERDSALNQ